MRDDMVDNRRGPDSSGSLAFNAKRVPIEELFPGRAPSAVISKGGRSLSPACKIPTTHRFMGSTAGMTIINQHRTAGI